MGKHAVNAETFVDKKELVQDWILLTFDIPAKEKSLRGKFLASIYALGAQIHTESVYLMPFSDEAMKWAAKLESAGHAVVWQAHQPDEKKAWEYTIKYDTGLSARCDNIEQRLKIAEDYIVAGKLVVANAMAVKTGKLLQQLSQIASGGYNPPWLMPRIELLVKEWKNIYGGDE